MLTAMAQIPLNINQNMPLSESKNQMIQSHWIPHIQNGKSEGKEASSPPRGSWPEPHIDSPQAINQNRQKGLIHKKPEFLEQKPVLQHPEDSQQVIKVSTFSTDIRAGVKNYEDSFSVDSEKENQGIDMP